MATEVNLKPEQCDIAVICALPREFDAVRAQFDEDYGDLELDDDDDPNIYKFGKLGKHLVIATLMPGMGKKEAAGAAAHFSRSFPNIRLGLLVGVCAGTPKDQEGNDILLGDVIISTAIIQYDFGREYEDKFVRKDTVSDNLPRPKTRIRNFLKDFETEEEANRLQQSVFGHLNGLLHEENKKRTRWYYPGAQNDKLFKDGYLHQHAGADDCDLCARNPSLCDMAIEAQEKDCTSLGCDEAKLVSRARLEDAKRSAVKAPMPAIHLGLVASGDRVLRSSSTRRVLNKKEKVIGFEMEGAGVWDHFPTIVIKGVCDYGDSHKNKGWQRYASATAASCTKALLERWRVKSQHQGAESAADSGQKRPANENGGIPHGKRTRTTTDNHFSGTFSSGGRMSIGDQYDSGGGSMHIS